MLEIRFSNRFELLAELLAARIEARRGSPFESDVLLVPSTAIKRRLTLDLARRQGICANLQVDYLAQWLWRQLARFDDQVRVESPFDSATLTWHAYAAFGDPSWHAQWPRLSAYLQQADDRMRFELARQVAGVLSHYVTYRTDWLQAWQQGRQANPSALLGEDEPWQAALWQRIAGALGLDPVNPLLAFAHRLQSEGVPAGAFPVPVHLFCLPDIAPLHLEVLRALARHCELHVYALNPCAEYWFDVVEPRRLAYLQAAGRRDHHEVGHRLLASWARQSQSQLRQLVDTLESDSAHAAFQPSQSPCLLGRLQDSILNLQELAPASVRLDASDRSLEVHVCHSRSRELEVLHDRLLGLFVEYPDLTPDQVLVVTPDLQSSAPLIDAVFGSVPRERHVPYQITGLARSEVNPVARSLLALLDLARSRWPLSEVLGLLEQEPISARFGLNADALEQLRTWLRDAGVRWGLDASHRSSLDLPSSAAHSFTDGLDRLFLGYAVPDACAQPFADRLAVAGVEGVQAAWLGTAWYFIESLRSLREQLTQPRSAAQWAELFVQTVQRFIDERGSPEDLHEVLAALDAFGHQADSTGGDTDRPGIDKLEFAADVARLSLQEFLDDPERGGVPTGAVTFAAISSLRAIPYRVVCMFGLDDGVFPGLTRPAEFDLMPLHPRPMDRQRQTDERNLFLDQLLSARQILHLSYVGRSIRDNSVLPPSVLISELLDHLVLATADDPAQAQSLSAARSRLVVEHPLQPFSPRSFRVDPGIDPRIASHHAEYAGALQARVSLSAQPPVLSARTSDAFDELDEDAVDEDSGDQRAAVFFPEPLPELSVRPSVLSIDTLERFFRNPARELLERRIGLQLPRREQQLRDDESFLPEWQDRDDLSDRLLPLLIDGSGLEQARRLAMAGTEVPPGALGQIGLQQTLHQLQSFAAQLRPQLNEPSLPPHLAQVEIRVGADCWRLDAAFSDLRAAGLVRYRDRPARPSDYLSAWLNQLLLWACPPEHASDELSWVRRDICIRFTRCEDPHAQLRSLFDLYLQGMREPLAFFPKTSKAFADAGWQLGSKIRALWAGSSHGITGERDDPAVRLAWRGLADPVLSGQPGFERCARTVFEPLLAHLRHD